MLKALVDTGGVRFSDAASLGVLVNLHAALAEAGIGLRIQRPTAALRRVSGICDLNGVLGPDPAPVSAKTLSALALTDIAGRDHSALPVRERGHRVLMPGAGVRS